LTGGPSTELAASFGLAAPAYAEHRPDYAIEAVRWALEPAPGTRVLDLGAGTGKLTATLVELGCEVIAVEPDPRMLAELRQALPRVQALAGRAEEIPLPDACVDAVVSGNAMHWFDPAAAGPELARVLAPGGVLAGLWNLFDDEVPWVRGLAEVGGREAIGPRDTPGQWPTATAHLSEFPGGFVAAERAMFPHRQRRTAESLVATLSTKAGILVLPETERTDRLERVRAYLAGRPETASGEFDLPLQTAVLRLARVC